MTWRYPFTVADVHPWLAHLNQPDADEVRARIAESHAYIAAEVEKAVAERDFDQALDLVGNEQRPVLLYYWHFCNVIRPDELAAVILHAWSHGQAAQACLTGLPIVRAGAWVEMFTATGFVSDTGRPAPTETQTLYRGAPASSNGWGMSWTTDRDRARWFADRFNRDGYAVFRADVKPAAVLAYADDRGEAEMIVNPRRLPRNRPIE
jgi:hypothetical protein